MPNRILRDWTDSLPINNLTAEAERFFVRLIMKADDYGRYHGHPTLLKANLFPFRLADIREADITRWMDECQKAGLVVFRASNSKPIVEIVNFGQKIRSHSKFKVADNLPADCQQTASSLQTPCGGGVVCEVEGVGVQQADAHIPTLEEVKSFAISPHCGFYPDRVEEWYHDQQANGWKYAAGGKNWKARMLSDRSREYWRKRAQQGQKRRSPNI